MAEVEEAYQTLEKNHGNSLTPEQLRQWANIIWPFFCKKDDKMSSQTKNEGRSDNCKFFEPLNCIETIILPRVGGITHSVHRATRKVAPADG